MPEDSALFSSLRKFAMHTYEDHWDQSKVQKTFIR